MILVFALMVVLDGEVDGGRTTYWYSIDRCKYFASRISNQRRSYSVGPNVYAYCVPEMVNSDDVTVYT